LRLLPLHVNFPTSKSLLYGGNSKKRANCFETRAKSRLRILQKAWGMQLQLPLYQNNR
jgi:hypothetical protein